MNEHWGKQVTVVTCSAGTSADTPPHLCQRLYSQKCEKEGEERDPPTLRHNRNSKSTEEVSLQKPRMKASMLALTLLLALACGEALKCNRCLGKGCFKTVETCSSAYDVCASVIFLPPNPINFFQRCMKMSECELLKNMPSINAICCQFDRCN
ncbi:cytotoxin 10-like [Arapaima gigas]